MLIIQKQTEKATLSPIRSATTCEHAKYEDYKQLIYEIKNQLLNHERQLSELKNTVNEPGAPTKLDHVTLLASAWEGDESPYVQTVALKDTTPNSRIDLMLSVEQLKVFWKKNIGFTTENIDGVIKVYAIGQKPTNDYTIQVSITEVNR